MNPIERRSLAAAPEFVQHLWAEAHDAMDHAEKQVSAFVSGLAEKGHVTPDEAARALTSAVRRLRRDRQAMTRALSQRLGEVLGALHVPSGAEIEALRARVASLQARVDRLAADAGNRK
jgi:polyhydroxyalkanoate synthesis regulator phasin